MQIIVQCKNGYAASIVKNEGSYGASDGKWELAVMDREGKLTYDTTITDNVVGSCDEMELIKLLKEISGLPEAP